MLTQEQLLQWIPKHGYYPHATISDKDKYLITIKLHFSGKALNDIIAKLSAEVEKHNTSWLILKEPVAYIAQWDDFNTYKKAVEAVSYFHLKAISNLKTKELELHKLYLADMEKIKKLKPNKDNNNE